MKNYKSNYCTLMDDHKNVDWTMYVYREYLFAWPIVFFFVLFVNFQSIFRNILFCGLLVSCLNLNEMGSLVSSLKLTHYLKFDMPINAVSKVKGVLLYYFLYFNVPYPIEWRSEW